MNILFVDTSTEYAIIGICNSAGIAAAYKTERHERQLSTRLYGDIAGVLGAAQIAKNEIDAYCAGVGPGSFTGVRVAVTTMRTLAQVTRKPLYAFGTLDAMAATARASIDGNANEGPSILALLPSRRDEVYAALYPPGVQTAEAAAIPTASAHEMLRSSDAGIILAAPDALVSEIAGDLPGDGCIPIPHPSPHAIAALIKAAVEHDLTRDPLSLSPMYAAPPAVSQHKTR